MSFRRLVLGLALLAHSTLPAATREEQIASIRSLFAEQGRAYFEAARLGENRPRNVISGLERQLKSHPLDLLRESIDRIFKDGTKEERTAAVNFYTTRVYVNHDPAIDAYHPMILGFLAKDDLLEMGYTIALIQTLEYVYPSRETLFAMMDAAKRAQNREMRYIVLHNAAGVLCHIDTISARWALDDPLIDQKMADFEAWVDRNRERIRFTKEGDFKLAGGEVSARQPKLGREDRERIRRDPVCVLRLMSALSESGESNLDAKDLTAKCGEALFGVAGGRAMRQAWEESSRAEGPSLEAQTRLSSLAGQYPYADAWLLAAAYVAAYETEPKAVALAKEALVQVSPSEIKRITQGEPRPVVKKARALANPDRREN